MIKKFLMTLIVLCVVVFLGPDLNPSEKLMFYMHDSTQVGRIQEYASTIKQKQIPPRISGNASFRMGYPLFNYYSPFAYQVTAVPVLLGMNAIAALKASFLASLIAAGIGMFLWLSKRFSVSSSFVAAILYVTSPYFAVEIFIRGSLSESWFLALLPISLLFIDFIGEVFTSKKKEVFAFIMTVLVLTATLTVHNVMSLLFLVMACVYIFLTGNKKGFFALLHALLLSSYFLIPAVFEMSLTNATGIASKTAYADHFLCAHQIWDSKIWYFGGSVPGCENDGFSFKLGKIGLTLGALGLVMLFHSVISRMKKKGKISTNELHNRRISIFIASIGLLSLFMTTYASSFIWGLFEPILAVFQFPWRFLVFGLFASTFFAAYALSYVENLTFPKRLIKFKKVGFLLVALCIGALSLIANDSYFRREGTNNDEYAQKFLSSDYIKNVMAFEIPEYVPKSVDHETWKQLKDNPDKASPLTPSIDIRDDGYIQVEWFTPFSRAIKTNSQDFFLNIHDAPYWKVQVNGYDLENYDTDKFGRPRYVTSNKVSEIIIIYRQTSLEVFSNMLTLLALLLLAGYGIRQKLYMDAIGAFGRLRLKLPGK